MPPRSKISRLPHNLREEIEQMVLDGRTNSEILEHLNSKGAAISRWGLHSHVKRLNIKMERYRQAQQVAAIWIAKLGRKPEGAVGRLLIEMLRMVAFRHLADLGATGKNDSAKPAEIAVLAKAVREMEAASKTIADRESGLRQKLRADSDRKARHLKQGPSGPGDVTALEKAKELVRGLL